MTTGTLPAQMTDEQLELHAFRVLARELGVAGYARFLRLFCSGRGDYTAERSQRLSNITVADIARRHAQDQESQT